MACAPVDNWRNDDLGLPVESCVRTLPLAEPASASGLQRPPITQSLRIMPTYEYKREDGTVFEIEQRITDKPLTACPTTGQKVKRLISGGAGLVFKGSGFYLTDYARKSSSPAAGGSSENSSAASETKSSSTKDD